jgi:hypothetical protein
VLAGGIDPGLKRGEFRVSVRRPRVLPEIYLQQNQSLPEVKVLISSNPTEPDFLSDPLKASGIFSSSNGRDRDRHGGEGNIQPFGTGFSQLRKAEKDNAI